MRTNENQGNIKIIDYQTNARFNQPRAANRALVFTVASHNLR